MNTDEQEAITTVVPPTERSLIKWLAKATETHPSRRALQAVSKQGDLALATDGLRAHIAQAPQSMDELPDTNEYNEANYVPHVAKRHVAWQPSPYKFPDVSQVLPEGEPTLRAAVNPKFLIEALQGFKGDAGVYLSVHQIEHHPGYTTQIVVQSMKGEARYALIMGFHLPPDPKEPWAPRFPDPVAEEEKSDG